MLQNVEKGYLMFAFVSLHVDQQIIMKIVRDIYFYTDESLRDK